MTLSAQLAGSREDFLRGYAESVAKQSDSKLFQSLAIINAEEYNIGKRLERKGIRFSRATEVPTDPQLRFALFHGKIMQAYADILERGKIVGAEYDRRNGRGA